jgi:hypothetical protein
VVAAVSPGAWVLAGTAGRAFIYRSGDIVEPLPEGRPDCTFTGVAGNPEDLAVFVGHTASGPALYGMAGGRWMRPLALPGVAAISDLARVSDGRWLVCGAQESGQGFACLFEPLLWEHGPLLTVAEPLVACASQARDQALAVGLKGSAVRVVDGHLSLAHVGQPVDLWSAAIDGTGGGWGGAVGSLWYQPEPGQAWRQAFAASHGAPAAFTSLFADVGRVVAMTRDGSVVEGRSQTARRARR